MNRYCTCIAALFGRCKATNSKLFYVFVWKVRDRVEGAINDLASRGYRSLGVAKTNQQGKWMFLGVLSLFDPPRLDTERTIKRALKMGITVKMVTGDQTAIAKETARNLG